MVPIRSRRRAVKQNAASMLRRISRNCTRARTGFTPISNRRRLLGSYRRSLLVDEQNLEALVKLSRAHIDIGDMISESSPDAQERKMKEYRIAEDYARKAIRANPNSTWGYFYVAGSLGSMAILSPVDKQIDIAVEIRDAVEKAIALDPQNGFAYHIYGVWHRTPVFLRCKNGFRKRRTTSQSGQIPKINSRNFY
jgi:hypothetical protein